MQLLGLGMTPEEQATVKEYESEVGKSLANIEKTSEKVHEILKNEAIFSEQLTESTVALKNTDTLLKEADELKKTLPNPQHSAFRA